MKKKLLTVVGLVLCAVLLVAGSIFGTFAYLTSQDSVTNTFTVGKVAITLDEAKVTEYGVKDGDTRVDANEYKLIPGHTYVKDPTIHVAEGSEQCYLFVKVENGISALEATGNTTIANQLETNGWTALAGVANVYYKVWNVEDDADVKIFEKFILANNADVGDTTADYANAKVVVTAYAVQADGFANAQAAWTATFGAPASGN